MKWTTFRCRCWLIYRGSALRCWQSRWHLGPHQGEDIAGPTWSRR